MVTRREKLFSLFLGRSGYFSLGSEREIETGDDGRKLFLREGDEYPAPPVNLGVWRCSAGVGFALPGGCALDERFRVAMIGLFRLREPRD